MREKPITVSHNQAMMSGPCLNHKLATTIMKLRFDKNLICFDLKKAFLQIELPLSDQAKLLFYWYKNVTKKDFSIITYKHNRLPFGLRPSPTLLLLGLYKILILDVEGCSPDILDLKRQVYDLIYMNNGAFSPNNPDTLEWAYKNLSNIFKSYQFSLQQFVTNNQDLQEMLDKEDQTLLEASLFGLVWNRKEDTFATQPLKLNADATTKRQILSSIATNFDLLNFNHQFNFNFNT